METNTQLAEYLSAAIREFNSIVIGESPANRDDLQALSISLTRLLQLGEKVPELFPNEKELLVEFDRKEITTKLQERFPEFGYYQSICPMAPTGGEQVISLSDAIDDLYDIYNDLNEALQNIEQGEIDNGLWHAKLLFGHWGRHLINLKSHLHNQLHNW